MSVTVKDCCTMYDPDKKHEIFVFFIHTRWMAGNGNANQLTTKHQYKDFQQLDNNLWKLVPSYLYSYTNPKPYAPTLNTKCSKEEIITSFNNYINSLFKWCATFKDKTNKAKVHEIFNAFLSNDSLSGVIKCAELTQTEIDYMTLLDISDTCNARIKISMFPCLKHLISMFGTNCGLLSDWLWKINLTSTLSFSSSSSSSNSLFSSKYIFIESLPEYKFSHLSLDYVYDESITSDIGSKEPKEGIAWVTLNSDDTYARYSNIFREIGNEQRNEFSALIINERYLDAIVEKEEEDEEGKEYAQILKNVITLISQKDIEWNDQDKLTATAIMRCSDASLFLHDSNNFDCAAEPSDIAATAMSSFKSFVDCQLSATSCESTDADSTLSVQKRGFFLRNAFFALTQLDDIVDLSSQDAETELENVRRKFNYVINEVLLTSVEAWSGEKVVPSHNLGLLTWMPKDGHPVSKDLEYIKEIVRAKVTDVDLYKKVNKTIVDYAEYLLTGKGYSSWMKWLIGSDKPIKSTIERVKKNAEERLRVL